MKYFLAGTFDNFHVGHQYLLWSAAREASALIIVIARNTTVEKIKKKKPVHDERLRLQRVKAENLPRAEVLLGREDFDFLKTLEEASPDVLYVGYDQRIDEAKIKKAFPDLMIKKAVAYAPEIFKSSLFN